MGEMEVKEWERKRMYGTRGVPSSKFDEKKKEKSALGERIRKMESNQDWSRNTDKWKIILPEKPLDEQMEEEFEPINHQKHQQFTKEFSDWDDVPQDDIPEADPEAQAQMKK